MTNKQVTPYADESMPAFAARWGLTREEFLRLNPSKRPPNDRIYLGDEFWIPKDAKETQDEEVR